MVGNNFSLQMKQHSLQSHNFVGPINAAESSVPDIMPVHSTTAARVANVKYTAKLKASAFLENSCDCIASRIVVIEIILF